MSDETLRILKLLEAGRITAAEAEELLKAVKDGQENPKEEETSFDVHPGRIVASVMKEVNPGRMVRQAIEEALHDIRPTIQARMPKMPKMTPMPEMPYVCFGAHRAEEEQVLTVPAEGLVALALNQSRSRIQATGIASDQIVIRARLQVWGDDQDEARERLKSLKVVTEDEGGTLRIKLDGPPWTKKRRAQVDFELEVPKGLALELGTASGDIELVGVSGGGKLSSASGGISLMDCSGTFEISTASGDIELSKCPDIEVRIQAASGDIEIKDSRGAVAVQSVSGDVSLGLERGRASVVTVSGDLQMEAGSLDGLSASTTSGDIDIELKSAPGGDIRLASVSGDVELELPDDADVFIDAATASGDIDCSLELAERSQTSRKLTGRLGEGRTAVNIRTTSGDIDIA